MCKLSSMICAAMTGFIVTGCRSANAANASSTNSTGRRLLAATSGISNSGGGSSSGSSTYAYDDLSMWDGYMVGLRARDANWLTDDTIIPEQARYVGANSGQNRVIGGLFLHTTRKTLDTSKECSGDSLARNW